MYSFAATPDTHHFWNSKFQKWDASVPRTFLTFFHGVEEQKRREGGVIAYVKKQISEGVQQKEEDKGVWTFTSM